MGSKLHAAARLPLGLLATRPAGVLLAILAPWVDDDAFSNFFTSADPGLILYRGGAIRSAGDALATTCSGVVFLGLRAHTALYCQTPGPS